jgi:hypothetical protein
MQRCRPSFLPTTLWEERKAPHRCLLSSRSVHACGSTRGIFWHATCSTSPEVLCREHRRWDDGVPSWAKTPRLANCCGSCSCCLGAASLREALKAVGLDRCSQPCLQAVLNQRQQRGQLFKTFLVLVPRLALLHSKPSQLAVNLSQGRLAPPAALIPMLDS